MDIFTVEELNFRHEHEEGVCDFRVVQGQGEEVVSEGEEERVDQGLVEPELLGVFVR